ncbi:MAG: hypothetical protein IPM69_15530 [Ignavibacteria bacterium]|nr:hypothetical protein [Ignavibacteria bacterium]
MDSAESIKNQNSTRRIGIVGINENSEKIISEITKCEAKDAIIVGIIEVESDRNYERFKDIPIIGNYEYLLKLIADYQLSEIIISDVNISKAMMPVGLLSLDVKLHTVENYEDLIVSRLVEEVTGTKPSIPQIRLSTFRNRVIKRVLDIFGSVFLLTVGLPLVFLLAQKKKTAIIGLWNVFLGRKSLVGLHPIDSGISMYGKIGLLSLAGLNSVPKLSVEAIQELNNYYAEKFTFSLDLDICLKFNWRK